jgi:hypothetical protein
MELIKINIFSFWNDTYKKIWLCSHYLMTDKVDSMDKQVMIAELVNKIVIDKKLLITAQHQITYETHVICEDGTILVD